MLLVDTDVLIWYMRGNHRAKAALDRLEKFTISVVTYMELIQGMRNKAELNSLHEFIALRGVKILHIDVETSEKAVFYMEQYWLSAGLRLADALIGATVIRHHLSLLTGNTRHYKMLKGLSLKRFTP